MQNGKSKVIFSNILLVDLQCCFLGIPRKQGQWIFLVKHVLFLGLEILKWTCFFTFEVSLSLFFPPSLPDSEAVCLGAAIWGTGAGDQREGARSDEEVCILLLSDHFHICHCTRSGELQAVPLLLIWSFCLGLIYFSLKIWNYLVWHICKIRGNQEYFFMALYNMQSNAITYTIQFLRWL